jgi:hypothetical protein
MWVRMSATHSPLNGHPPESSPTAEPFSIADLKGLEQALERLIEHQTNEWPTREGHHYLGRLEYLRHEVRRRLP